MEFKLVFYTQAKFVFDTCLTNLSFEGNWIDEKSNRTTLPDCLIEILNIFPKLIQHGLMKTQLAFLRQAKFVFKTILKLASSISFLMEQISIPL